MYVRNRYCETRRSKLKATTKQLKSDECCPLCKSDVGKLRVMYVNHVTSSEKLMKQYLDGTLTYANWLNDLKETIEEDE